MVVSFDQVVGDDNNGSNTQVFVITSKNITPVHQIHSGSSFESVLPDNIPLPTARQLQRVKPRSNGRKQRFVRRPHLLATMAYAISHTDRQIVTTSFHHDFYVLSRTSASVTRHFLLEDWTYVFF